MIKKLLILFVISDSSLLRAFNVIILTNIIIFTINVNLADNLSPPFAIPLPSGRVVLLLLYKILVNLKIVKIRARARVPRAWLERIRLLFKNDYITPRVLKTLTVAMENDLLLGSVVTKDTQVQSTGQETQSIDFSSDASFNHSWEN